MLYELITLGSLTFWILLAIFGIIMVATVACEKFIGTFLTFVAFCAIFFTLTSFKWTWVVENRDQLWILAASYVVGAVVTSFMKWYFHVRDARDKYNGIKEGFLSSRGLPKGTAAIPDELQADWGDYLASRYSHLSEAAVADDIIPYARDNKSLIVGWMTWWPFVVFWSLFDDFFRRVWELLYRLGSKLYQGITTVVFRGVEDEINMAHKAKKERDDARLREARASSAAAAELARGRGRNQTGFYKTGDADQGM
jgi:hypothetical protein